MKEVEIDSRVENGKFKQNNELIRKSLHLFNDENVVLTIRKRSRKRSQNQNRFYWGVWIPIFQKLLLDEWQEFKTPVDVHDILKTACNYEEKVNQQTGEQFRFPKSTKDLTIDEWEYLFKPKVKQFAMDFFSTILPEPNEQLKIDY